MTRRTLSDSIWEQLQTTMKAKGCHFSKNNREVMEAIVWKLRTGAPWRDIPTEFCPWQTAYNRFNRWAAKGLWADFFLNYEARLMKNGFSPTEVMFELTSMRVELGVELGLEKSGQLADLPGDLQQRFMSPPMRMETRLILKSLGVKFTMPRRPRKSSKKSARPKIS